MDFISGDLDRVFTVLLEMGRVEPLLEKDWKKVYEQTRSRWGEVSQAIRQLNSLNNLRDIRIFIGTLPSEIIDALVVEVARELADYQENKGSIH